MNFRPPLKCRTGVCADSHCGKPRGRNRDRVNHGEAAHRNDGRNDIRTASEVEKGTHFYVEFPLADRINTDKEALKLSFPAQPRAGSKDSYSILYVEDNPANLSLVEHILQPFPNLHLITASNAEDGA